MVCPVCGEQLIWGNDFDTEDGVTSMYSCNECNITIYVTYNDDVLEVNTNDKSYTKQRKNPS